MDQEFIQIMLQIEEQYQSMNKHCKIRVEAWTKKLCQVTTNEVWKKNRNLYARILLQQVLKNQLSEPFDKRPSEGPLPKLNKYLVPSEQKENAKPIRSTKPQSKNTTPDINEKILKLLIDCRAYLEKRNDPEAILLRQQQDEVFQWIQPNLEKIEELTEEAEEQQQFMSYLDKFERKTEKLKEQSDSYLKQDYY
ncbi:hypothetical protein pb186bvf_000759 [Paramecium bursaria]